MATQNRRDFFKTAAFIGATAVTLPNASTKAEGNSKLSKDRICVFIDTANLYECSFCKHVCLFQLHTICSMESKEYSIVLILIL